MVLTLGFEAFLLIRSQVPGPKIYLITSENVLGFLQCSRGTQNQLPKIPLKTYYSVDAVQSELPEALCQNEPHSEVALGQQVLPFEHNGNPAWPGFTFVSCVLVQGAANSVVACPGAIRGGGGHSPCGQHPQHLTTQHCTRSMCDKEFKRSVFIS
jgi:hypothetical protein